MSFNITCFASGQSIAEGDKFRLVPISQCASFNAAQATSNGKSMELWGIANTNVYADCFWKPMTGFIQALYEDCTQFKLAFNGIQRMHLADFFETLFRQAPVIAEGKNSVHERAFDFPAFLAQQAPQLSELFTKRPKYTSPLVVNGDQFDAEFQRCFDYVLHFALESRLFVWTPYGERPVQFAVVCERAYEELVSMTAAASDWDKQPYEQTAYLRRTLDTCRVAAVKTQESSTVAGDRDMTDFWFADHFKSKLRQLGDRLPDGVETTIVRALARQLYLGELTEADFIDKCKKLLGDRYAFASIDAMHLRLTPMSFAGHDTRNSIGSRYASFVADVSKRVSRDRSVAYNGPYSSYSVMVSHQDDLDELKMLLKSDHGLELADISFELCPDFQAPGDIPHRSVARFSVQMGKDALVKTLASLKVAYFSGLCAHEAKTAI